MSGATLDFSAADVSAAAAAYDPALHEAPIVVGHPQTDAPAYGWIAGLTFADGGDLEAVPQQVDADFAQMVRDGRFKHVSASFYSPESPANPKPGAWYLRHVGFLGAAAPAVKGLKPASFADDADGVVEIEFAEGADDALWAKFKTWLFGQIARDDAAAFAELSLQPWDGSASRWKDAASYCSACLVDQNETGKPKVKTLCHLPVHEPSGELNRHALIAAEGALVAARRAVDLPATVKAAAAKKLLPLLKQAHLTPVPSLTKLANFSEAAPQEDSAMDEAAQAARDAEFAEREKAIKAREEALTAAETKTRNQQHADFVEQLVKAGKLLPRDAAGLTAFMAGVAGDAEVSFAEGTEQVKAPAIDWLQGFLSNLPKAVDYSEHAHAEPETPAVAFAAPQGTIVDPQGAETFAKAKAYQAAHPNTEWLAAVRAVGG